MIPYRGDQGIGQTAWMFMLSRASVAGMLLACCRRALFGHCVSLVFAQFVLQNSVVMKTLLKTGIVQQNKTQLQETCPVRPACSLSEDSDQPAHSRSLIRIFTVRILDNQWCFLKLTMKTLSMRTLIWVFIGRFRFVRTCHEVCFRTMWLRCFQYTRLEFHTICPD